MSTVCLFDIDGTLLNTGGAGQTAMELALAEVFQITGPTQEILAAGRTDKAITTDLFAFHKVQLNEQSLQEFLRCYLTHLPAAMQRGQGQLLPGVKPLLDQLNARENCLLGLLTGNYETAAWLKLRHFAIDTHFRCGGFGDLHLDRDDVARSAHQAVTELMKRAPQADRLWVIGDTPSDIKCGKAIGAKTIAVATGIFPASDLEPHRPDVLLESLADVEGVLGRILH